MKKELEVYRNGLIYCSVCTNVKSKRRIVELVNQKNPSGLNHGWTISIDAKFVTGQTNPCPCEQKEGFKHYLMVC